MSLAGIIVSVYENCYNDIYIVMFVNIYDYVCVRPNQFNVLPPPVLTLCMGWHYIYAFHFRHPWYSCTGYVVLVMDCRHSCPPNLMSFTHTRISHELLHRLYKVDQNHQTSAYNCVSLPLGSGGDSATRTHFG